jgi:hypothetical protein
MMIALCQPRVTKTSSIAMSFCIPHVFTDDALVIEPVLCALRPARKRIAVYWLLWVLLLFNVCIFRDSLAQYAIHPPRGGLERQEMLEFLAFFGGVEALIVLGIFYHRNRLRNWLLVGENGFAVWTPRDGETVVPWENFKAFRYEVLNRSNWIRNRPPLHTFDLSLRKRGALKITSDEFSDLDVFAKALEDALKRYQLPKDFDDFQNGEEIDFGPVVVAEDGVRLGKLLLEWKDAHEVKLSNGVLMVRRPDGWSSWSWLPLGEMPNISVFIALVNRIAKSKRSGG